MHIRRSWFAITAAGLLLIAVSLFVQRQLARDKDRMDKTQTETRQPQDKSAPSSQSTFQQLLPDNPDGLEFERTIVADAPFSATLITEVNKRMPDGSVSRKTNTVLIYRDRQGRTRRDWLPESSESHSASGKKVAAQRSVINDPVTGFSYQLGHRANVAQRSIFFGTPPQSSLAAHAGAKTEVKKDQVLPMPGSAFDSGLRTGVVNSAPGAKPEQLGIRTIEGVLAEGTRISLTLSAGIAENEQPVEISTERWYAPSIEATVLIKRTDSRVGETTYRLIDIKRGEPAKDLFVVPQNYRVLNETGREVSGTRKTPRN
jgi:hypothetical protein